MDTYEITSMIIDDDFDSEEYVTVNVQSNHKQYSMTLKKADLELINTWVFEEETSLPANLPESMIESIRQDIKKEFSLN